MRNVEEHVSAAGFEVPTAAAPKRGPSGAACVKQIVINILPELGAER